MPKMKPPLDAKNVTYNGAQVGADGVVVLERDVPALAFEGWALVDDAPPAPEED